MYPIAMQGLNINNIYVVTVFQEIIRIKKATPPLQDPTVDPYKLGHVGVPHSKFQYYLEEDCIPIRWMAKKVIL